MRSVVFVCVACLAVPALGSLLGVPVVTTQFQAQDALGQYNFGYAGDSSSKQEIRTHDGVTRGSFSYVDGHGVVQSRSYVSDDVNGFRVVATDLPVGPSDHGLLQAVSISAPTGLVGHAGLGLGHLVPQPVQDTPEVTIAKIQHAQAHAEALAREHGRRRRSLNLLHGGSYAWSTTQVHNPVVAVPWIAAPAVHSAVVAAPHQPSVAVVGSVAAPAALSGPEGNGAIIAPAVSSGSIVTGHGGTVVSPPVNHGAVVVGPGGAHSEIPIIVSPLAGHAGLGLVPQSVQDTPEVTIAKIQHAQAHAEALAREHGRRRRSLDLLHGGSYAWSTTQVHNPVVAVPWIAAPAVHSAVVATPHQPSVAVVGSVAAPAALSGPEGNGAIIAPAVSSGSIVSGHGGTVVSPPVNHGAVVVGPGGAHSEIPIVISPLAGHAGLGLVPQSVQDTPEVTIAKIQHAQAHAEALAREHGRRRRSLDLLHGGSYAWSTTQVHNPVVAVPWIAAPAVHSAVVAAPHQPSAAIVGPVAAPAALSGPEGNGAIIAPAVSSGSIVSGHGGTVVSPPVNHGAVVVGPGGAHSEIPIVISPLAGHAGLGLVPQSVQDTPEVTIAKIQHAQAHAEALAREHGRRRRSLDLLHGGSYAWSTTQVHNPVVAVPWIAAPAVHSAVVAAPHQPSAAIVGPVAAPAALSGPEGNGAIIAPAVSSGSIVSGHGGTVVSPPVNHGAVVVGPGGAHSEIPVVVSPLAGHAGLGLVPQSVQDTPEVTIAKIQHAQAHAEALYRDHGRRRRSLGGVEAVVGPSAPATVIAGPDGAGVVIAPAAPGGSVVRQHGLTVVSAPAAPATVLAAPVQSISVAHGLEW